MYNKAKIYVVYTVIVLIGLGLYIFTIFLAHNTKTTRNLNNINTSITKSDVDYTPYEDNIQNMEDNKILDSEKPITNQNNNTTTQILPQTTQIPTKPVSSTTNTSNIYKINATSVNVRQSPSTDSAIVKQYKRDMRVEIVEITNEWGKLSDGGYIHMTLLSKE